MPRRPSEVHSSWGDVQQDRRDIVVITISENGVRLPVHSDVAAILIYVLRSAWDAGYRSWHKGNTWGLSVRTIRGRSDLWSSHAYGTAVDVASDLNPMTRPPMITDQPEWLWELFEAWGFRAGARWTRRPDPMHFSAAGTRAQMAELNAIAGTLILAENWGYGPHGNPIAPNAEDDMAITKPEAEDIVDEAYDKIVKRKPDKAGREFWTGTLVAEGYRGAMKLVSGLIDEELTELAAKAKIKR